MIYTLIAYMSDGSTYCRGCEMDRWGSDFMLMSTEDPNLVATKIAEYRFYNESDKNSRGEWELHILIYGRAEDHNSDDETTDADCEEREKIEKLVVQKIVFLREAFNEEVKKKAELEKRTKAKAAEASEKKRRELYESLKKEFDR